LVEDRSDTDREVAEITFNGSLPKYVSGYANFVVSNAGNSKKGFVKLYIYKYR